MFALKQTLPNMAVVPSLLDFVNTGIINCSNAYWLSGWENHQN
jgi:hypothetical protein